MAVADDDDVFVDHGQVCYLKAVSEITDVVVVMHLFFLFSAVISTNSLSCTLKAFSFTVHKVCVTGLPKN